MKLYLLTLDSLSIVKLNWGNNKKTTNDNNRRDTLSFERDIVVGVYNEALCSFNTAIARYFQSVHIIRKDSYDETQSEQKPRCEVSDQIKNNLFCWGSKLNNS